MGAAKKLIQSNEEEDEVKIFNLNNDDEFGINIFPGNNNNNNPVEI